MAPDNRDEAEAELQELADEAAITRVRVASDVEALGKKLAPANLKTEAKQAVLRTALRHSIRLGNTVLGATRAMARAARRHPVPLGLSLVGLGIVVWRVRRA